MNAKKEAANLISGTKAKVKATLRLLPYGQLSVIENAIADIRKEKEGKIEKAAEIKKQLDESNMTIAEVSQMISESSTRKLSKSVPIKYRGEFDGEVVEWTGRGRTPKAFSEALAAGASMEDFLVEVQS